MKIVTVVAARPQFTKCAAMPRELREICDDVLAHAGQLSHATSRSAAYASNDWASRNEMMAFMLRFILRHGVIIQ
jgi:hypothetical protein